MECATMPEKKGKARPTGPQRDVETAEEKGEKESQTSMRLFTKDRDRLAKLTALTGEQSIAVTFRRLFGKLLDNAIIAEMEAEARRVRSDH